MKASSKYRVAHRGKYVNDIVEGKEKKPKDFKMPKGVKIKKQKKKKAD